MEKVLANIKEIGANIWGKKKSLGYIFGAGLIIGLGNFLLAKGLIANLGLNTVENVILTFGLFLCIITGYILLGRYIGKKYRKYKGKSSKKFLACIALGYIGAEIMLGVLEGTLAVIIYENRLTSFNMMEKIIEISSYVLQMILRITLIYIVIMIIYGKEKIYLRKKVIEIAVIVTLIIAGIFMIQMDNILLGILYVLYEVTALVFITYYIYINSEIGKENLKEK